MSLATDRNAAVRAALRATWPGAKFTVTRGVAGAVRIHWTDGPTQNAVERACTAMPGYPAGVDVECRRFASPALFAAAQLRAAAGDAPVGPVDPMWGVPHQHLDAADVTDAEWARARTAVAMAGVDPARPLLYLDDSQRIARLIHTHRAALDAVTATTSPTVTTPPTGTTPEAGGR